MPSTSDQDRSNHIGRWRLTRLIGQGAITRVFQAGPADRHGDWPADYVVKTISPTAPTQLARELLRREAAASRAACSEHLPALLEADLTAPEPYLVFPFLRGGSLDDRLSRYGTPPLVFTFWMARQVLAAIDAMHNAGWAHGDIKPANILVSDDVHTTLIDLGFARELNSDDDGATSLSMATPGYAAPEIHTGGLATQASDLYSVGVTMFELLTGRRPFVASTPEALMEAHRFSAPPDIRQMQPHLPVEAQMLVRRLLAKDPAERPDMHQAREEVLKLEIDCFDRRAA